MKVSEMNVGDHGHLTGNQRGALHNTRNKKSNQS